MRTYVIAFLTCIAVIFAMGLLMVFNTTAAEVLDRSLERSTHHALVKQILYAVVGGVGAALVSFCGYRQILRLSPFFLAIGTVLLILVFIPGIGQQINGARRWVGVFGNSLQPSEFVKYLIPVYFIHVVCQATQPIKLGVFLRLMGTLSIPIGLILIEPDNGTVAIIMTTLVALFMLTKIKWSYWMLPLSLFVLCGVAIASQMPHVSSRIQIYLDPELDLKGKGHQPYQAKIAAGSGKLWGKGLGESLQKLDYLPEARSDYIAAIYAEEFGFIGMLGLLFAYMLLGLLGFFMAQRAVDLHGFYLIAILVFLISFQAFLNLGVVSGLLPSKGTNLPFFSQGGSNLLASFMAVALIINVTREKKYV
ncbi:MAG: putative peptidoglycan glycosyltransferase FtsW [Chlamydiota bacterium]